MTLTDRLSASFLGALAVILVGFSAALWLTASAYLDHSVDARLETKLATLAALAEDEPGGFDWEHDGSRLFDGEDDGPDQVRWRIVEHRGEEVDRSENLDDLQILGEPGHRRFDSKGRPWRVVRRRLQSKHLPIVGDARTRYQRLDVSAALRLDPIGRTLRNLALTLVALSLGLWALTAAVGRWLCRRALAPLTRMASAARELGADEPGRRLPAVETRDELGDLSLAFNGLLDRWQEALERQSRFSGDASHQLRTPLTALIGQVDVALRRDRTPEEYLRTLGRVRDQSERLRRIVESLLFLARADAEAGLPSVERVDLQGWVAEQSRRRREEGADDDFRWESSTTGPIEVMAHPELLAEILDNLLDNARDHGGANSPVVVRLAREAGWASMAVEDRGPGIEPADLGRIFEPFYRTAGARLSAPGGVGLGLAVARRIALALGGRLDVESEVGRGSRFTVRLPEVPGPAPQLPASPAGLSPAGLSPAGLRTED